MIVLLHVAIALASIVFSSLMYFAPSKRKFTVSYSLTAATLISGTYLVVSTHAPMLQACTSGLFYLGIVSIATVLAHRKLAHENASSNKS